MSRVGDVDQDGTDDSPRARRSTTSSALNSGLVTCWASGMARWTTTGSALGYVGDLTGDGAAEILVGAPVDAPARAGYAQVIAGGDGKRCCTRCRAMAARISSAARSRAATTSTRTA
ncbi:MAG: hypothetical protein U1E76_26085 [Planctomycetota bacterium]